MLARSPAILSLYFREYAGHADIKYYLPLLLLLFTPAVTMATALPSHLQISSNFEI